MDFLIMKNSENSILLPLCKCTLFLEEQFYENKTLGFAKKKTKLRTKSGMLNIRAKLLSLPFAILNIIRAKHQNRAWMLLILYCMQASLLSLFYHILLGRVTDCTENKHYKRSFLFLSHFWLHHTPISDIIDHYCIMRNFKKIGKNQEQIKNNMP